MAGSIDDFENSMDEEELDKLNNEDASANPDNGNEEEETSTVPPTEEKLQDEEEGAGSDPEKQPEEYKGPFHKHPRWIAREKRLKEYEERDRAREAELVELREKIGEVSQNIATAREEQEAGEEVTIPEWFVTLYGDDPDAYLAWLDAEEAKEQEREERLLKRMEDRKVEASQKEEADVQWVEDQLTSLQEELEEEGLETFDGLSEEELKEFHNGVLRIVRDYIPTDEDGNISFRKAYNILQNEIAAETAKATKPKSSVPDKKRLTSRAPSAHESSTEEVASNETFQTERPW